jgi:hypothetical protein
MKWYYYIPFVSMILDRYWERVNLKAIRKSLKQQ